MESAIEIAGLRKSFGTKHVLRGVDLRVPRGGLQALLGPNGAGKSTTVKIAATLLAADAGTVRIAGFDAATKRREIRRRISLTGQAVSVDPLLTGAENLRLVGRLSGLPAGAARARAADLLARFDLAEAADRRVSQYSGGMARRLDLAAGLVRDPEVVFLDEPTTGLDPRSRARMWQVVAGLAASGVTILLTTQYLEEADQLADRISVIDGGRVVAEGTAAELKQRVAGRRLDLRFVDEASFTRARGSLGDRAGHVDPAQHTLGVSVGDGAREARAVLDEIDPDGSLVAEFSVRTASLDDVFLALTEKETAHV